MSEEVFSLYVEDTIIQSKPADTHIKPKMKLNKMGNPLPPWCWEIPKTRGKVVRYKYAWYAIAAVSQYMHIPKEHSRTLSWESFSIWRGVQDIFPKHGINKSGELSGVHLAKSWDDCHSSSQ